MILGIWVATSGFQWTWPRRLSFWANFLEEDDMKVQVFGYRIFKTESIECLEKYKSHRRLSVFYHKGTACCECNIKGTILVYSKDKHKNTHVDLCTDDYYPLTVDHIVPKSKGGSNDMSNLRPLCCSCNHKKADKMEEA